ncbi:UEV-domain-containing protein [Dissoconium aciculare CBS 342.82]|uniref:UEV-domain-containing protein n=1 Tax=Dissoconium aciculare CBS 342.82 TaxID=1314786 RepID=A0A6J3MD14_9PEZI|nr:UEV-domain-containing protein [Dissoconium aciculare CBS 342.82]KAF1825911.1 UEV-domain-containing protein [Dissoconium aciculare CBS 342.82]
MAQVPEQTLTWLYSRLHDYHDPQRAYTDIARTLSVHTSLLPRTDAYTYESGAPALLLNLDGTIPANFRGTTYRFPIKLWVPQAYPQEPPMVYVHPSKEMLIRPGQHVGIDGRIYHPYLRDWASAWDRANIVSFLEILQQVFAKETPVISRAQQQQLQRPIGQNSHLTNTVEGPPRLPPKPNAKAASGAVASTATPPPRPPKPGEEYTEPSRDPEIHGPPLPPRPPQARQSPSAQSQYGHNQQSPQPVPYRSASGYTPGPVPGRPYGAPVASPPMQIQPPVASAHPQVDLLSSPLDSVDPLNVSLSQHIAVEAPPIPPNPEKEHLQHALRQTLNQQIQGKVSNNLNAIGPLSAQNVALRNAAANLAAEIRQLEQFAATLSTNEDILRRSMQDAIANGNSSGDSVPPAIDDLLINPTLVAGQLWRLCAEEAAAREAMYVLQRGLGRGRVSGPEFIRLMRGLARECFFKMALARKCARGMGLDVAEGRTMH